LYPGKMRSAPKSIVMTNDAVAAADLVARELSQRHGFKVSRSDAVCRAVFELRTRLRKARRRRAS